MFRRNVILIIVSIILFIGLGNDVFGEFILKPSLTMKEQYDSNYFSAAQTQNPEDDFVTTISPTISISYMKRDFSVNGFYSHNFRYLSRISEWRDDGMNRSTLSMKKNITENTSLSINDSFSYVEDTSRREILASQNIGIQTRRTDRINNNFSFAMNHRFSPRTSVGVTLKDRLEIFFESTLIDSRTDSIEFRGSYELSPNGSISMNYSYTNFYFDLSGGGENRGSHSLYTGYNKIFSPTFSLNISGGGSYRSEPINIFTWVASAGIVKTFQISSINLSYNRGITNTSGLTNQTSINQTASLVWKIELSETFDIRLNGSFSNNRSEPDSKVDTNSYRAGIRSEWQLYKWMNIGFSYVRSQQFANGPIGDDISRDIASISATITPTEWRL